MKRRILKKKINKYFLTKNLENISKTTFESKLNIQA